MEGSLPHGRTEPGALNHSAAAKARLTPANADELPALVKETLSQLQAMSPAALAYAKKSIYAWDAIHFDKGLARAEKIYLEELISTEDSREGIAAFIEKRPPKWTGK